MNRYVNWPNLICGNEFLVHKSLMESAAREPVNLGMVCGGVSK